MNKKLKLLIESMVYEIIEDNMDPHKYLPNIIKDFTAYAKDKMGFNKSVKIILRKDKENSKDFLGKTGLYDPNEHTIILYVTGRHPKDIMRTLSHELIHHTQNCNERFMPLSEHESQNVKDNDHIKELEREAYEKGNLIFREWEEKIKEGNLQTLEEFNAMGTGAVVGYMAPLGANMGKGHDPKKKGLSKPYMPFKKPYGFDESVEKPEGIGKAPLYQGDEEGIEKIHNEMEAGDEELPLEEEFIGKKGGLSYFQMGGGIKDPAFYNKTNKGKPTRNPGVPGLKK